MSGRAHNNGADTPESRIVRMVQGAPVHGGHFDDAGEEPRAPQHSDEALAQLFAKDEAERLRYVAVWGYWLWWDDHVWARDETLVVPRRIRRLLAGVAANCENSKTAVAIASAKTVAAVERLARSDRRLAATVGQWDADAFLLNTPGGVVNLLDGSKSVSSPFFYQTKMAAVAPGGDCPIWLRFLERIFSGDAELIAYVQRIAGYALTASTEEHALFFCYGTGANGKSVFISTLTGVLNTYAQTAAIETFTVNATTAHPAEIARHRGARLVTCSETEQGHRLAEARVKQLTGGDTVVARLLYRDHFEFTFTGKIIMAGNHKPSLRSVGEAIRRRMHLVPFSIQIPPEERDGQLTEKLKSEWPGILAWAIEGAQNWREMGLAPPAIARAVTSEHFEAEDALGQWLESCCDQAPGGFEPSAVLFQSWRTWAEKAGEFAGTMKTFVGRLKDRGFENHKERGVRGLLGVKLRSDGQSEFGEGASGDDHGDDGF